MQEHLVHWWRLAKCFWSVRWGRKCEPNNCVYVLGWPVRAGLTAPTFNPGGLWGINWSLSEVLVVLFQRVFIWDFVLMNMRNFLKIVYPRYEALHVVVKESWIKRDQLDVTCFIISLFNAQRVSDVNTSILRSLRLICWVISWVVLLWYDVCWCYVVVWLGWCGIRMQAEALPASGYHTTPAKPHRNTNTHRTRAIQPMK